MSETKKISTRNGQKRVAFNDTTHEDVAMLKLEKHKITKNAQVYYVQPPPMSRLRTPNFLVSYDTQLYARDNYISL